MIETLPAPAAALRLWRTREELFPGFTRRAIPDDLDFASGSWASMINDALDAGAKASSAEAGTFRVEPRYFTPAMCQAEPGALFVFGDNFARKGSGPRSGQAVIRDEPNAVGIVTKHLPSREPDAYLRDADLRRFKDENGPAFTILAAQLQAGGTVVWPAEGVGTGRAALAKHAPRLWASLERARERLAALGAASVAAE